MPAPSRLADVDQGKRFALIQGLVGGGDYHYSDKVRRYIEQGWYGEEDLERCVFTATSIHKIEVDEFGDAMDGCKYTILGSDTQGSRFYTCGKIVPNEKDERLYFFITAHEAT